MVRAKAGGAGFMIMRTRRSQGRRSFSFVPGDGAEGRGLKMLVTTETRSHGEDAKRSVWVTVSLVLQGLWTLALLGLAAYSLTFSVRYPRTARDSMAFALFSALQGLLVGIGWYGLWRRKLWGWWLACICSWALTARAVYVAVVEVGWSMISWGHLGFIAYLLILPICVVMPATIRFYWNKTNLSEARHPH
jgi:hypothetical protein